ncbi:PREDICTED: uncharacterized protein LOC104819126 [Tarenaya hassleriana]|uniref:uncharacterized protein LOC104819126 n=1 Tax=Tarenaya hassleriana TaxID=28532 RepID=UPI00053C7EE3|nr:PREDICTED: uncharacterized protein LOC104819126 [Tarenaya hassleriana]
MRELESFTVTGVGRNPWPPVGSPMDLQREEPPWRSNSSDDSVSAVSFGFVATAILISMFLAMAIFERLIRPTPSRASPGRIPSGLDSRVGFNGTKLGFQSPKMAVYSNGVSVLMPGDEIPTFMAHPAPVQCHRDPVSLPHHHHNSSRDSSTSSNSNSIQEC